MKLGYVRGANITQQLNLLEEASVDELFSDNDLEFSSLMDERSELMQLMYSSEPQDVVYIAALDTISRNYGELKEFIHLLDEFELTLFVVDLPNLTNHEWLVLLHWCQRNERIVHPRLLKMGKEKQRNANSYSFMTKDPQAKKLYRETIWAIVAKKINKENSERKKNSY